METKLEQLQREKEQEPEQDKGAEEPHGWKRIVGIFADKPEFEEPEFEEAVRAGKEWRDSFRPSDYEGAS